MTRLAVQAIRDDLAADLSDRFDDLQQMASAPIMSGTPSDLEWHALATSFLEHHAGFQAVEYIDASYRVVRVESFTGDLSDLGHNLKADPEISKSLEVALASHKIEAAPLQYLPSGRKLLRPVIAVYSGNDLRGFLLAKIDAQVALADMLADVSELGYGMAVFADGQQVYIGGGARGALERTWGQETALDLPELHWTIRAWPTPGILSELRSWLPEVALMLGSLITAFVLSTLYFAYACNRYSQQTASTNRRLNEALARAQAGEDALRHSQARFAGVLEMSLDGIVSVDEQQCITLFNKGAETIFGYTPEEVIGKKLDLLLPTRFQTVHRREVEQLGHGHDQQRQMTAARTVMGLRKDGTEFPLEASISKLDIGGEKIFTAIVRDVTERQRTEEALWRAHDELEIRVAERTTDLERSNAALEAEIAERKQAELMLRQLSGRLLQLQDEERRHIARELHDSTAQYLAALALDIAAVETGAHALPQVLRDKLSAATEVVERCSSEIRTMSYLLHPPILDDLGLRSAIHWYAGGYEKRSGVAVKLDVRSDLERMPPDVERTLFRIVQECLTNIRRHSGADRAKIRLVCDPGTEVRMEISDNGRGMPQTIRATSDASPLLGVGIAGMRERVRQLGGRIEFKSSESGTLVITVLPLTATSADPSKDRDEKKSVAAAGESHT